MTAVPDGGDAGWTRDDDAGDSGLPAWHLNADHGFYVERWGPGSYSAWHGDVRIGEPGSYATLTEAQEAAVTRRRDWADADAEHHLEGLVS